MGYFQDQRKCRVLHDRAYLSTALKFQAEKELDHLQLEMNRSQIDVEGKRVYDEEKNRVETEPEDPMETKQSSEANAS